MAQPTTQNSHRRVVVEPLKNRRNGFFYDRGKSNSVPEERGHGDEKIGEKLLRFIGVRLQKCEISVQAFLPSHLHSPRDAAKDCRPFVAREVVTRPAAQQIDDLAQVRFGFLLVEAANRLLAVNHVPDLTREARDRRDEIHDSGPDRSLRHRRIFGLVRVLHEDDAAGRLDRPHAERTVRARAAQHDRDGVASRRGDRVEERVDGRSPASRLRKGPRRQDLALDDELAVRRNHVNAVRLQCRRALNCLHGHRRARRKNLGERARLIGREMHDDDIGETEIVVDVRKNRLQSGNAARRSSDGAYGCERKIGGVWRGQRRLPGSHNKDTRLAYGQRM